MEVLNISAATLRRKEVFMKKRIIFLVMLVCLLAFAAVLAFAQNNPNVRWEYSSIIIYEGNRSASNKDIIEQANRLGEKGWELVTTFEGSSRGLLFKRRLP